MTLSAGPALKQLYTEFGDRIDFVALYVREAHPGDRYPQPARFERKLAHARDYRERDQLPWPVAIDSIGGDLHRTLDPKPSPLYIVDREGNVAFRTLWSNERAGAIRQALKAVAAGRSPVGERTPRLLPMLRGTGVSAEVWDLAGVTAKRDVLKQAPPMYLMAQAAGLFRPLPPAARTLAGTAALCAVTAAGVLGARTARARLASS